MKTGKAASAKVVHLTSVHTPYDTRILHRECAALAAREYDVVLVAAHPQDERVGRVAIHAVPRPRNRAHRITQTVARVWRRAAEERGDIYHFHDPELIPVGLLLKAAGRRVVYDVHEDVPLQTLSKYWLHPIVRHIAARVAAVMEWIGAKLFDGVVVATPPIAERFPKHKTTVVQNFPDLSEFTTAAEQPYKTRRPLFAYVGAVSEVRGIKEITRAVGLVPEQYGARIECYGDFRPKELEQEVRDLPGGSRLDLHGWGHRDAIAKLLASSKAGLVVLHPIPNYIESYPVKMFEYMAAGLPVIASDFPLWRSIVTDAQCGLLVDPLDPNAIAQAMQWILDHPAEAETMGRRGREAVHSKYNWNAQADKLAQLYERLLARSA